MRDKNIGITIDYIIIIIVSSEYPLKYNKIIKNHF